MTDELDGLMRLPEDVAIWWLKRRFPRLDIFREATEARGVRYHAHGTADEPVHTVITDDLGELAEILARAERLAGEGSAR